MAYLLYLVARFFLTEGFCRLRLQSPPSPPSSAQWISPLQLDLLWRASLELLP
jgi:hypothetical protein